MSLQNAMAFAHKLDDDEALKNKVKALTSGDSDGLLKLASGLGFEFTTQELKAVIAHTGELTDDQLDRVAAGGDGSVKPILIGLLVPPVTNMVGRKAGRGQQE